MYQFDVSGLFREIGGSAALRRALAEDNNGVCPTEPTVAMWRHRNRISQRWLASCVFALLSRRPALAVGALLAPVADDPGELFER